MKKLKGFTLVELAIVMAITITMAGVTLTSNTYNEKEAINNVAVKCQTLIAAARNEAITQRAPRWVTLNYSQNQVTNGKIVKIDGKDVDVLQGTYPLPAPVIFASGGTDLYLYFDAFGELEVYNSAGLRAALTANSAGVHTDDPTGVLTKGSLYLAFLLTNKAGTLVEEVRINQSGGGGGSTLSGGTTTPVKPLTAVISGPSAGKAGEDCLYFSAVEGGKPPYKYAWSGGENTTEVSAASFTTQWAAFDSNTKISLTVTDSLNETAQVSKSVFPQTGLWTASISGPSTWDQGVAATFTAVPAGGVPPYSYVWTCGDSDAKVRVGMDSTFIIQWSMPSLTPKTISLTITDSSREPPAKATWSPVVYPLPTVTIAGPTSGKLATECGYTSTVTGGCGGLTYAWTGGGTPATATGPASAFTTYWAATGVKPVSLTITDSAGQSATSAPLSVTIYSAPTVTLTGGIANGKLATDYTYTPTVTGGQGPYTYIWGGGGTPTTGTVNSFTTHWASAGPKTLTLTVKDALGQTATLTPYNVTLYVAPTGTVSGLGSCFVGINYTCTASFSGGMAPLAYAWTGGETPATGTTNPFTTQWSAPNTYTLRVTVTDALGQTGPANMNVVVTQRLLTYTINPSGVGGTVTLNPAGGAYAAGTVVTLMESPAAAYNFSSWGGDGSGVGTTTTVTMNGNKAVTANFVLKTFTLTYTAGANGTISGNTSQTVNYGAAGTAVTAMASTNYKFVNWSDGVATAIRTDTNVITNIAVTANFVLNQFLVTFKNWDGTTLGTPSYVTSGGTATPPANPTKTGYTFAAWNRVLTNITATTTITATFTANVSGPISIVVGTGGSVGSGTNLWRQATSNTDFDGRGNGVITVTNSGTEITYEYAYNQNLTWTYHGQALTMVSGSKYYAGMDVYISPDANIPATGTTWVADIEGGAGGGFFYDNTKKGIWQRLEITQTATAASGAMYLYPSTSVIYATTGVVRYKNVTFVSPLTTTLTYAGSAVPITATPATGYTFAGWAVIVNPAHVSLANANLAATTISATSSMPQGGIATVAPSFTINQYTVTFKNWDGTTLSTQNVNYGGTATAPGNPSRTGYTFASWDRALTNITATTTINATFTINYYTVTFVNGHGTTLSTQSIAYGGNAAAPGNPTYTGQTFAGWSGTYTGITSAVIITATWSTNYYTVTFVNGLGTTLSTQSIAYGGNAAAPGNPARTGYTFAGWSGTYTGITSTRTITATWSIITYTITTSVAGPGTVTGTQYVTYGGSVTIHMYPSGYNYGMIMDGAWVLGPWYNGAGGSDGAGLAYTLSNVTANHSVVAHFENQSISSYSYSYSYPAGSLSAQYYTGGNQSPGNAWTPYLDATGIYWNSWNYFVKFSFPYVASNQYYSTPGPLNFPFNTLSKSLDTQLYAEGGHYCYVAYYTILPWYPWTGGTLQATLTTTTPNYQWNYY